MKPISLSRMDRARLMDFFEGTSICSVIVEGSAVAQVPDAVAPTLLNGYPHGFTQLACEDGMELLSNIVAFETGEGDVQGFAGDLEPPERSFEVRQALVVDGSGRRVLRKTLLVNGTACTAEDLEL